MSVVHILVVLGIVAGGVVLAVVIISIRRGKVGRSDLPPMRMQNEEESKPPARQKKPDSTDQSGSNWT